MPYEYELNLAELKDWCESFVKVMPKPFYIYLDGDLGSGKTTFTRHICESLGVLETVTSPSYQLLNNYLSEQGDIIHIDLYRLEHEQDLDDLCVEEMVDTARLMLIEWHQKLTHILPPSDVIMNIRICESGKRRYQLVAMSARGKQCLDALT